MLVEDVAKLSAEARFLYWMRERHNIYLRRKAGQEKPWTDDEVMRNYFFTNPYREHDKVTVWFKENIREPLRDSAEVIFATVCFRWFNLPEPTGKLLMGATRVKGGKRDWVGLSEPTLTPLGRLMLSSLVDWDPEFVLKQLDAVRQTKQPVFTGAFMINSPPGEPKLEAIIRRINNVWQSRKELVGEFKRGVFEGKLSMEEAHGLLTEFDGLGGFMAYEVVCDLRYTWVLEKAGDKLTWCNPGPGCIRGLYRIAGEPFDASNNAASPPRPKDWQERMQRLLRVAQGRLKGMPKLEMREIEHSLCEFDKYERIRLNEGKSKRRYNAN